MSPRLCAIFLTSSAVAGFGPRRHVAAPRRVLDTERLRARALILRGGTAADAQLHIAGKLYPMLRSTVLSTERAAGAVRSVLDAATFSDLIVMLGLFASASPLARTAWLLARKVTKGTEEYDGSYCHLLARGARRLARLMLSLYAFDLLMLFVIAIGLPARADLPLIAAAVLYPAWAGRLASKLKAKALGKARAIEDGSVVDGKVLVYDRLADFAIFLCVILVSLEVLSLELGVAFTSLVAVSGASSVVVALACQEPLSHVINGLLLTFNDKFRPGDEVAFGDVAGFVTAMGWFDTSVRRYDERTVVVPNGKIMGVPLTNLSRVKWGQYKTEIRLRLEDMPRADAVTAALQSELRCMPDVITRGRNVWTHWRTIEKDCIILVVDIKLAHPFRGTAYYDATQQVNARIARAVASAGAEFAYPTSRRVKD